MGTVARERDPPGYGDATGGEEFDRVGQVDLSLRVVVSALREGGGERRRVEAVERGVHPGSGGHVGGGKGTAAERDVAPFREGLAHVGVFDDAERAVAVHHHVSAVRVFLAALHAAHGERRRVDGEEFVYETGGDDLVAHRHHDGTDVPDVLQHAQPAARGVAGAELFALVGEEDATFAVERAHHALGAVSGDHDEARDAARAQVGEDAPHHGHARAGRAHLVPRGRAHARALPGAQDDRGDGRR